MQHRKIFVLLIALFAVAIMGLIGTSPMQAQDEQGSPRFVQYFDHYGRQTVTVVNEGTGAGEFRWVYACRPDLGEQPCPSDYNIPQSAWIEPGREHAKDFDISEQCWGYQWDPLSPINGTGWVVYPKDCGEPEPTPVTPTPVTPTPVTPTPMTPEPEAPGGGYLCALLLDYELKPNVYAQIRNPEGGWDSWDGYVLVNLKDSGLWEVGIWSNPGAANHGVFLISYESGAKTLEVEIPEEGGNCWILDKIEPTPVPVILPQGPALQVAGNWWNQPIIGKVEIPSLGLKLDVRQALVTNGSINQPQGMVARFNDDLLFHQSGFPAIGNMQVGDTIVYEGVTYTVIEKAEMSYEDAAVFTAEHMTIVTCNESWTANVVFTLVREIPNGSRAYTLD